MVYQVKDSADFQTKLTEAEGKLVVVDFYATWCGPCKMIAPVVECEDQVRTLPGGSSKFRDKLAYQEYAKEFTNVVFLKVDVDECEDIAATYEITSMPTFVFFKNKERVEFFAGAHAEKVKTTIQKHSS